MFERAFRQAIENLAKVFSSPGAFGREVGKAVGKGVIVAPAILYVKKHVGGGKTKEVRANKHQEIHHHDTHGLNVDGLGQLVAAIYIDDDGHFHKMAHGRVYTWNGASWV